MHSLLVCALFSLLASVIAYPVDQGVSNWSPNDPLVTIINTSSQERAYDVETDSQAPASAFKSCTGCIRVAAGQTIYFHPGPFNGALTANQHTGTRHECNFLSEPGRTWYDADMEYGMSDETLGPSDYQTQLGSGAPSLAGEPDTLAKANAAWKSIDDASKQALLDSGFLQGTKDSLTHVTMGAQAPNFVVYFYQITAKFNAYIGPGSVAGKVATPVDQVADKKTSIVGTNKMTITIYQH